jgi:hypothetical protein
VPSDKASAVPSVPPGHTKLAGTRRAPTPRGFLAVGTAPSRYRPSYPNP